MAVNGTHVLSVYTYLSNGPLTLYLQAQLGVSMVHLRDVNALRTVVTLRWIRGKKTI